MLKKFLPPALGLLTLCTGLVGCSSFFNTASSDEVSCPYTGAGLSCKSPIEVYRETQGDLGDKTSLPNARSTLSVNDGTAKSPAIRPVDLVSDGGLPRPVLAPEQPLEIWIAPHRDAKGDLHYPSYLFTVVKGSEWSFGESEFSGSSPVIPHLLLSPSRQAAPDTDRTKSNRYNSAQPSKSPWVAAPGIPDEALPHPGAAILGDM